MIRRPPRSTLFPYPPLFRSRTAENRDLRDLLALFHVRGAWRGAGDAPSPFAAPSATALGDRSEEHTSELQSRSDLVCRLLLEKKNDPGYRLRGDRPTSTPRH